MNTSAKCESALAGRHIVVTRPLAQMTHMLQGLIERSAIPVKFPVLAINALADVTPILNAATRLDSFDLVIFVSPNAVTSALDIILQHRPWPTGLAVATVGHSSEQELAARGIRNVISPVDRFDSEALLALPLLQSADGKRVLICRGSGGRPLLGDTLAQRGASVEYLTCYLRSQPETDPAPLLKLWQAGQLDAITLTSTEGMQNFLQMIGHLGVAWLKKTPVFVPHSRIFEQAKLQGLNNIVLTAPTDDGLLAGLEAYFADHGKSA